MKKTSILLLSAVLFCTASFSQTTLENITRIKEGHRSKRISSYDDSGGNNDRFENIEHGHNNCLTLEMASVAYWYLDKPSKVDPIPTKEERKLMPVINFIDMHRWRHEWRKNKGEETNPWGNEL